MTSLVVLSEFFLMVVFYGSISFYVPEGFCPLWMIDFTNVVRIQFGNLNGCNI